MRFDPSVIESAIPSTATAHAHKHDGHRGRAAAPLSLAQQQIWRESQSNRIDASVITLHLQGRLDRDVLRAALERIAQRHELLHSTFDAVDGQLAQVVATALCVVPWTEVDVAGTAEVAAMRAAAQCPDHCTSSRVRAWLLRRSDVEHWALIRQQGMATDDTSARLLVTELAQLYRAFYRGHADPLAPLQLQYVDYAISQRQRVSIDMEQQQLEFWRQNLRGAPCAIQVPTDRPRSAAQSHSARQLHLLLHSAQLQQLEMTARQQGTTLDVILLTAWVALLSRWSGDDELIITAQLPRHLHAKLIGPVDNSVMLRVRLAGNPTLSETIAHVAQSMTMARANGDVPLSQVVAALESSPARQFYFDMADEREVENACAELREVGLQLTRLTEIQQVQWELSLSLQRRHGEALATLAYSSELFEPQTIERFADSWRVLLDALPASLHQPIDRLPLLAPALRRKILSEFNATELPYRSETLIHEIFEEQARRSPDKIAVICEAHSVTYAELDARANGLAEHLRRLGVGPDQLVALCVERSIDMVVGLLGILKAGGAYLPLDPRYPVERIAQVIEDASPRVLLTQRRLQSTLPSSQAAVIMLDDLSSQLETHAPDLSKSRSKMSSRQLAYVIYTSGSTGRPKGVMVEHAAVVNFLTAMRLCPGIGAEDCLLAVTTISFDIAGLEIFLPLVNGARLVLAEQDSSADPQMLIAMLDRHGVSILQATPATWQMLLAAGWCGRKGLKALCGGEALTADLARRLVGRVATLWNLYGPTETTIWSCCHQIHEASTSAALESIGRPIANTRIYILDQSREVVPIGVVGEIYIGGAGVARGYLHRSELTSERFLSDPFVANPQARMYRTGDLVRWRDDGTIEYVGRIDHQVKIRGFRVELGEIEAQLQRLANVKSAVVVARENRGEKRLAAYLIPEDVTTAPEPHDLRSQLGKVLPHYMVPAAFMIIDRFPLTPNGKLDRRALPAPDDDAYTTRAYEPPRGEMEELLAELWQQVLGLTRVGRNDNFFELGGHSVGVVQLMQRLREAGYASEARRVFEAPSLANLARTLEQAPVEPCRAPPCTIAADCAAITPQMLTLVTLEQEHIERIVESLAGDAANIQDIYPLAPLQQGLLFHHLLMEQRGDAYVRPMLLLLESRERLNALVAALQAVVDRHDVLRTAIRWEQLPQPLQIVSRKAALPIAEISLDPDRDPVEQLQRAMMSEHATLDLGRAPLIRLEVAADPASQGWYALLWTHHMVCDNQSMEILLDEVLAHLNGNSHLLSAPSAYREHVAQALANARPEQDATFFRGRLADIDTPTAPFGVLDVRGDGSRLEEAQEALGAALTRKLRAQARRLSVSPAALFHAAWALVVARTSGRDDVVFGTVLLGRMQGSAGAQQVLGMFINTLPLRVRLHHVTAEELVRRVWTELVALLDHEQASLAEAQRCSGLSGSEPLFTSLLNYAHRAVDVASEFAKTAGVQLLASRTGTSYPLVLSINEQQEGFTLELKADRSIGAVRVLRYMLTAMHSLVAALDSRSDAAALLLPVLPEPELHQVLESFNATQTALPERSLIHQLFEEQVQRTPDAVAVMHDERSISYCELNRRANQLAWHLRERGVEPDQLVAICMERSIEMVVGMFAILKAGGAYVPLDPGNPAERLQHLLADACPRLLITQRKLARGLPETAAAVIVIDDDATIGRCSERNPDSQALHLNGRHLAYVIYTSGSTGKPKGVMIEHRSIVNYALHVLRQFDLEAGGGSLICTSFSFDLMLTGLYPPLLCGKPVRLCSERQGVPALPDELLRSRNVAPLKLTPSHLGLLEDLLRAGQLAGRVAVLVVGGEPLQATAVHTWRRYAPDTRIFNHYGPTEATVGCVVNEIPQDVSGTVPIGRPIANTRIYVLNPQLQPVPVGVEGEIYIGGAGVARGYFKRADLTVERFLADPFDQQAQSRMYKSGDRGRWRPDGTIEYLGRSDQQVKIRGYRIELGEIEAQIRLHPGIRQAVVVVRESAAAEKRLVAYVIYRDESCADLDGLRARLRAALPEYMVPSAFVVLSNLPVTSNGKLDRRALPEPHRESDSRQAYEPPHGHVERALADIWREVLQVDEVGRHHNFFELGGHSLLAMQVAVRIRSSFSIKLSMTALFDCPTIELLGAQVATLIEERLHAQLQDGGSELESLIEEVASMSDNAARELMARIQSGARP